MLLIYNCEINIKNNEGLRAKDLATNKEIRKLIENFEQIYSSNLQKRYFNAVMTNNIEDVQKLVSYLLNDTLIDFSNFQI